jgi:hypothetical protein
MGGHASDDRIAIFLRASAELVSGKYCHKLVAVTTLGQGKCLAG